jgi:hypothetical protein
MATNFGFPNPLHYIESTRQLASVKLNGIAKECGEIEFGDGFITWLGSELGTLRLYREYGGQQDRISQGFSQNLGKHFFTLEF